jgi:hypothetical protein
MFDGLLVFLERKSAFRAFHRGLDSVLPLFLRVRRAIRKLWLLLISWFSFAGFTAFPGATPSAPLCTRAIFELTASFWNIRVSAK